MTDTNNTDGAALLPVTQAERDLSEAFCQLNMLTGPTWRERVAQLLSRHRQSSSNAGGVDPKRIEDCINAAIGHGEHGLFVDVEKATESILASLSTPTAKPMGDALTPSALSPEPVQKVHELPEGHRWCRHCEQKDPHCSVCEGVGYLPDTAAGKDTP